MQTFVIFMVVVLSQMYSEIKIQTSHFKDLLIVC